MHAFEKPQGTAAKVHIHQVITSVCTKLHNKDHMTKAPPGTKFHFPSCWKIYVSKRRAFTKFNADESEDKAAEKWLVPSSYGVQHVLSCSPLGEGRALHPQRLLLCSPIPYQMFSNKSHIQSGKKKISHNPLQWTADPFIFVLSMYEVNGSNSLLWPKAMES